jgi:FKBP-type peptidyl-prolyl cis-trans isomerase
LRKILAVLAASALLLSAAGCSSINSASDMYNSLKPVCGDVTTGKIGSTVAGIDVVTHANAAPTVTFAAPLVGDKIETKVIEAGTGPKITGNQNVDLEYEIVNAGTGAVAQSSSFTGKDATAQYLAPSMTPPFCTSLGSVHEGSTVAMYLPAKLAHNNQGIAQLKIGAQDSVIFILKITKVYLPHAVGNEQGAQTGFPSVVRAVDGTPGVTVPTDSPFPKASKDGAEAVALETLLQGVGPVVAKGDTVMVHYAGYTWADGAKFDSSWDNKAPVSFTLTDGSIIPGFMDALVGQKVGSQIVAVIPPSLGYKDQAQGTIPANSTLVFVVDILGIKGK